MKKIKQILVILVTIMCIFNFMPYRAHADDNGYYIKNMDVQVEANDKRELKIRETLKVYFNEEKHGIMVAKIMEMVQRSQLIIIARFQFGLE